MPGPPGSLARYSKTRRSAIPTSGKPFMATAPKMPTRAAAPAGGPLQDPPHNATLSESLMTTGGSALQQQPSGPPWLQAIQRLAGAGLSTYGKSAQQTRQGHDMRELLATTDPDTRMRLMELMTFGNTGAAE